MNLSPVLISFKAAFLSTFFTFFIGLFAANMVKKLKKGAVWLDIIFTLPMVLPPTVMGFILLIIFGTRGPFAYIYDKFNFQIVFSFSATVIAAVVVSFPLMYRSLLSSFLQIDENIILSAKTLGLSNRKIFWKIILPLSKEGILTGIILSFTRALGEFGATIMISGNIAGKTQTISTAIYSAVQSGNKILAFKYTLVVIFMSVISIFALNFIIKKKVNYGFISKYF